MAIALSSVDRLWALGKELLLLFKGNQLAALLEHELPAEREGTLTVRDNRTGSKYKIPIIHNAVPAAAFRQICVDRKDKTPRQQYEDGPRVVDPGYRNTAVKLSAITYMCVQENYLAHHLPRAVC
jgi:citrate synthase